MSELKDEIELLKETVKNLELLVFDLYQKQKESLNLRSEYFDEMLDETSGKELVQEYFTDAFYNKSNAAFLIDLAIMTGKCDSQKIYDYLIATERFGIIAEYEKSWNKRGLIPRNNPDYIAFLKQKNENNKEKLA